MEENKNPGQVAEKTQEPYVPRPAWQVWGARIGLVIFISFVIFEVVSIARGGM